MTGIANLGAEAAQQSQTDTSTDSDYENEYERFDLSTVESYGRQHPATAIRGEAVALLSLFGDGTVIMDNPSLFRDEETFEDTVVAIAEDESDDFKAVDLSDSGTSAVTAQGKEDDPDDIESLDDILAVDVGESFYGDVQTNFPDEYGRIALKRGGSAGYSIASVLDGSGRGRAGPVRDDDGNLVLHDGGHPKHNKGLIEQNPNDDADEYKRFARDPALREDVEGTEVIVMVQRLANIKPDYDGDSYWATVFANLGDERIDELAAEYAERADEKEATDFVTELDGDRFLQLQPTDEFEPSDDLVDATGWLEWTSDYSDAEFMLEVNQRRIEEDFDPYIPVNETGSEIHSRADIIPDSYDGDVQMGQSAGD